MPQTTNISALFLPEPLQWGLRGDPFLWRDMALAFEGVAVPDTADEFKQMLEAMFLRLTGQSVNMDESSVFVEHYSHGGMSSGRVSCEFWERNGFALLLSRYAQIHHS